MNRRDMEGSHLFSNKIKDDCKIYDLQGLLLDRNKHFTAAVEAFEYSFEDQLKSIVPDLMSKESVFAKALFASSVRVDLFIFVHLSKADKIIVYQVKPNLMQRRAVCVSVKTITEAQFIEWWAEHKQTKQTKPYRAEVTSRIRKSYFDGLLEPHGLKWGGNIDGFTVDMSKTPRVNALIENRFSKYMSVSDYDPRDFFKNGGGDYHSWLPLFQIKDGINVPLILCTYSKMGNHIIEIGATKLDSLDKDGIKYDEKFGSPTANVFRDTKSFKQWFDKVLLEEGV